jgi:signal transduction histidine kinase
VLTTTDIATLVLTVCDQYTDIGYSVRYEGLPHALAPVQAGDLLRAVNNLIDNAVRYGTQVTARLAADDQGLTIDVEDDGPGIPDAEKGAMMEPFARGDAARNMDSSGGFGLGLAIARAIVEAQGGQLSLHDRHPHGLVARIILPRSV